MTVAGRSTGSGGRRLALVAALLGALSSHASAQGTSKPTLMSLPTLKTWNDDFDSMLNRRVVRILVPPSRTLFFQDKGEVRGVVGELALEFEKWLNKRHGKKPYKIVVALVPTPRDQLLTKLREGKGDIAAGNLTVTPARSALVDFAAPWGSGVKEVLVTGPSAPGVATIADLGGKEIRVRKTSSYYEHLAAYNERIAKEHGRQIRTLPADENLEDEDLLEMVSAGVLPWVVVDDHLAKIWATIFKGLTVREDIAFNEGGEIAWAIRKDSPKLKQELAEFVGAYKDKPIFNDILLRYYRSGKTIKNVLTQPEAEKFSSLVAHFRTYGGRFAVDPILLAAQGYQESGFDQSMKMKSGAVGIMQMKPSSAREKEIAIDDIAARAEDNIHAGAKYMRYLADKYIGDPGVDDFNRALMSLAAYNAGPGSLKRFREHAAKAGFNPNIWFGKVEHSAAALGGQEKVQYVGNVYKYFVAYKVLLQKVEHTEAQPPK